VAVARRQETIAMERAIHVGMRVVRLVIQMTVNRVDEDRGVETIPARVRPIVTVVADADVIQKGRKGRIVG